jgi:hypothetical protein
MNVIFVVLKHSNIAMKENVVKKKSSSTEGKIYINFYPKIKISKFLEIT